jgi:hypothetical protein
VNSSTETSTAVNSSTETAFKHWFAGFVDGEGCFYINRTKHGKHNVYSPGFKLTLREDDNKVIGTIQQTLGFGQVYYASKRGKTNASVTYSVQSLPDCKRLIGILDLHPLRSKKLRDYLIWREAVDHALLLRQTPRANDQKYDWSRLIELKHALETGRKYQVPMERYRSPVEPYQRMPGSFVYKIDRAQLENIRARVANGETMAGIAREFGVLPGYISKIIHGHKWRGRGSTRHGALP